MVVGALGDPKNIAVVGSSPKDLALLANDDIKTNILAILCDVSLGDKLSLLSELDQNASENAFVKKEMPYISRFTLYSILKDIIAQAGIIRENNTVSYKELVGEILVNNDLSADAVVVLRDLIEKNEGHYLKHFGDNDILKLNIVKKVLKNYT